MPKKQDWLDIIEKASKPKKGTKIPKGVDVYSLSFVVEPNGRGGNGRMQPWNTGAGADGMVQPNKPVALDTGTTPPSVYHEGENVYPFPGGKKIVPAQTEQEQQELANEQRTLGYPGYQIGGTVYDDPTKRTPIAVGTGIANPASTTVARPTNTFDLSSQGQNYQTGQQTAFERTGQRAAGTDPLMENITNRALQEYDTRAAVSDTAMRQGLASSPYMTEGARKAVAAKEQATYRSGLSGLMGDLSAQSMQRMEQANRELYEMGRTGTQDELAKQQFEKTFGEQQYQADVGQENWQKQFDFELQKYGDQEFTRMADAAQTTSFDTWKTMFPGATWEDYTIAREYKNKQLDLMNIEISKGYETIDAMRKSGQWADAQRFLDAGDINGYANYVRQITGKDLDPTELYNVQHYNWAMRSLGIDSQTIANDAARLGVNAAQLEAFIYAVNNGADLAAANQASGLRLSPDQFEEVRRNYTYEGNVQQATISRLVGELGDQRVNSIVSMIGAGASMDRINALFPEANLSVEEFANIKANTPAGQTEWNKGVQVVNMLLSSGDPANIRQASQRIGELFPGVSFSVDQLINDIGAERFAGSLTDLATLSSTFDSWGDALRSVSGMKLIQNLGLIGDDALRARYGDSRFAEIAQMIGQGATVDEVNKKYGADLTKEEFTKIGSAVNYAREMFDGLKINALDEEWSAIKDSDFFQSLDEKNQKLIKDTLTAGLTGELEYNVVPAYEIVDPNGNFVKEFDNIVDVNKFIGENADKGYSYNQTRRYIYKNILTGDSVVVNNQGDILNLGETPSDSEWQEFKDTIPPAMKEAISKSTERAQWVKKLWQDWMATNPADTSFDAFAIVLRTGDVNAKPEEFEPGEAPTVPPVVDRSKGL